MDMSKTQAAHAIAMHVNVAARDSGKVIDKMLVAEILSEYGAGHRGQYLADVANHANHKTVLRIAHQMARSQGEHHLIPRKDTR